MPLGTALAACSACSSWGPALVPSARVPTAFLEPTVEFTVSDAKGHKLQHGTLNAEEPEDKTFEFSVPRHKHGMKEAHCPRHNEEAEPDTPELTPLTESKRLALLKTLHRIGKAVEAIEKSGVFPELKREPPPSAPQHDAGNPQVVLPLGLGPQLTVAQQPLQLGPPRQPPLVLVVQPSASHAVEGQGGEQAVTTDEGLSSEPTASAAEMAASPTDEWQANELSALDHPLSANLGEEEQASEPSAPVHQGLGAAACAAACGAAPLQRGPGTRSRRTRWCAGRAAMGAPANAASRRGAWSAFLPHAAN